MDKVLIIDFGGEITQKIARIIRNLNVFCEIVDYDVSAQKIISINPKGLIIVGKINHELLENNIFLDQQIYELNIPILAIGYGFDLLLKQNQINLIKNQNQIDDSFKIIQLNSSQLFKNLDKEIFLKINNETFVNLTSDAFEISATDEELNVIGIQHKNKPLYGIKSYLYNNGNDNLILNNFLLEICNINPDWNPTKLINVFIEEVKQTVKNDNVLCAISGGVDSLVSAKLVSKAIGKQLYCVFVDHGLLRKNEVYNVCKTLKTQIKNNIYFVDKKNLFLNNLKGIKDPEEKRKIIGNTFIDVFIQAAKQFNIPFKYLLQGTIYPDIVESGSKLNKTIKSHHNVGGLPSKLNFQLLEPLKYLFKDEVRQLGIGLDLPIENVYRQPFPGPGLGVRIIGEINEEKIKILQEADYIFRSYIEQKFIDYNQRPWQYFAILTDSGSVGIKNNQRVYGYTIALRAIETIDAMTAKWSHISLDDLDKISNLITNKIPQVNRVVYDITNKPPATIEWE